MVACMVFFTTDLKSESSLSLSLSRSQTPSSVGRDSPEQRSFRDRQKYFEIDVKQQTPDKPKPRISLVGEDDLKKMKEEEGLCLFSCQTLMLKLQQA